MHRSMFGLFRKLLTYKCEWYGRKLIVANRLYPSTQRCAVCGMVKKGDEKITLKILKFPYKKEILQVAPEKINPPKSAQNRIKAEIKEIKKIYDDFEPKLLIDGPFIQPLNSKITSAYGTARIYNNELKSFHSGTDFRARSGTKIQASNAGIVRIAKDLYYCGNGVIIDHGAGIYTQYCHLSKILVKNGEHIKKGQIIALSGASGRVNGPHLHFGVFANGAYIDPLRFIKNFNKTIFDKVKNLKSKKSKE